MRMRSNFLCSSMHKPQMVPRHGGGAVVLVRHWWQSRPLTYRTSPKSLTRITTVFVTGWIGGGGNFRQAWGRCGDGVARLWVDSGGNFEVCSWHGGGSARGGKGGRRGNGGGKTRQQRKKEVTPPTVHNWSPCPCSISRSRVSHAREWVTRLGSSLETFFLPYRVF
jgi:hypothetical protein